LINTYGEETWKTEEQIPLKMEGLNFLLGMEMILSRDEFQRNIGNYNFDRKIPSANFVLKKIKMESTRFRNNLERIILAI